jgi:histone H3/H4
MTEQIARAIAKDAANARMRKAGRVTWNRADYNLACRILNRLMGW